MQQQVAEVFKTKFQSESEAIVFAPGRINLIGEHLDYNHGYVMPGAIDKGICFALSFALRKYSELYSIDLDESYISNSEERPSWAKYIRAVLSVLKGRNLNVQKFSGVFTSNLPVGAGLSSSAALCCGFVYALNELHHWQLTKLEMALIGQQAEHRVGIKCGLMDQFAVMHGQKDQVILLDCLDNSTEIIPAELGDYQLVLINSKVSHSLMDTAYNDRRSNCEAAFSTLQHLYPEVKSFRDLCLEKLDKAANDLRPDQLDYVTYVIEEIARVKAAKEALRNKDLPTFGNLLNQSHAGLSEKYRVTCKETDLLVPLAQNAAGTLGARQMGGGFGGCVIILMEKQNAAKTATEIAQNYQTETGIEPEVIMVRLGDGVRLI